MKNMDFNLLGPLNALLAERSVTGAALRLGMSVSAMSRTLARLRDITGDHLLLQAGRAMVLTPYAEQLSERIPALVEEAIAVLKPAKETFSPRHLEQCFVIKAGEGFIDLLAAALLVQINRAAPSVTLRFVPKQDWDAQPHRNGKIDLEIGTVRTTAPELRTRLLFRDRYVVACRHDHDILKKNGKTVSAKRYATATHISVSKTGERDDFVDIALQAQGLERRVALIVPSYTAAMQVVRHSDLLALIPFSCVGNSFVPEHAAGLGLTYFEVPVPSPIFDISLIWHSRFDNDPAHVWLRKEVRQLCEAAYV